MLVCAAAYGALGAYVATHPLLPVDRAAAALVGIATPLAIVLTESALFPALAGIALAALALAWLVPAWRARALFAVVLNVVAWKASDVLKDVFRRPRPEHWVWHRETSFSYSSGHATDAVVVYVLWAYFVRRSDLPRPLRAVLTPLLVLWALGIGWSRLALGVHYPSDVLGGYLLGTALLALALAVYDPVRAPAATYVAGRTSKGVAESVPK